MIDVNELKKAIELLDPKKDEHWDDDGNPSTVVLSGIIGAEVTIADLREAGSPKRAGWKPLEVDPTKVDMNDPNSVARALAVVRGRHADLVAEKDELESHREAIRVALVENGRLVDEQITLISKYSPVVDQAQGVKRIQEQTMRELQRRKETSALALSALAATGVVTHASKLDAVYAARRRTPEQTANMAKFVHQNAAARNAAAA